AEELARVELAVLDHFRTHGVDAKLIWRELANRQGALAAGRAMGRTEAGADPTRLPGAAGGAAGGGAGPRGPEGGGGRAGGRGRPCSRRRRRRHAGGRRTDLSGRGGSGRRDGGGTAKGAVRPVGAPAGQRRRLFDAPDVGAGTGWCAADGRDQRVAGTG